MRKILSIMLVFVFAAHSYGQTEKRISIPTDTNYKNEVDTTLWYKWKHELIMHIGLKDLQTSTDTFHFRFWTDVQALDLWTNDHKSYFAIVTNYAERYDDKLLRKNVYKIGKVYSNQVVLDSSKAREIFNMIDKLSILTIASDDKITGWGQGFDGVEFLIENFSSKQYEFKTYWTPRMFADSLREAKQIQTFVDYLNNDFKIYEYYQKLALPEGSYKRNGIQGIRIRTTNHIIPGGTKVTDLL